MPVRTFLGSKLHRAVITEANVEYSGSIGIDTTLLKAAGIRPFERVDVYNVDNGERLTTYAIAGGPGEICLNGAAAHKGRPGQRVIIATYVDLDEDEMAAHKPRTLIIDDNNAVTQTLIGEIPVDW